MEENRGVLLWVGEYPPQMMLWIHIECGHVGTRVWCREWWGEDAEGNAAQSGWACRLAHSAFLQLVCSQNAWWKVKVQRRLSIFTRIMLCLSFCFPTPLILPFLSPCWPSLRSFMWWQERWFSSSSDPGQVHCADNSPFPSLTLGLAWTLPLESTIKSYSERRDLMITLLFIVGRGDML